MTPFDFSPTLRTLFTSDPDIARKKLCDIASVSPTTLHRFYYGHSQPEVQHLRAWHAAITSLPYWFRRACAEAIGPAKPDEGLDADGDGRITSRDARQLDARGQEIAARRRLHLEGALDDGVLTSDEVSIDAMLADQLVETVEREKRVMCRLAGQ